jgi:glutamate decarboxylase
MAVQRILVRHGFSRDLAELLMDDYRAALSHFAAHPISKPLTEAEAGGFTH